MQSTLRTIRRTALAATLTLAVVGAGANSAIAAAPAPDAPSIERVAAKELRKITAKDKRKVVRKVQRAMKSGDEAATRADGTGSKKQSRALYRGCVHFSDASICGYETATHVFLAIVPDYGAIQYAWATKTWWNVLVYYYG